MAPWALWALGKNKKNKDPILAMIEEQRAFEEKREHAQELALWAHQRAGAHLEMALGLTPAQGQEQILRTAILYAACAKGAFQSARDAAVARSEAEDAWLAQHGVEVPAWSRTWVFAKQNLHEAMGDETLFAKVVEAFADVEEKLRPEAEARGNLRKYALYDVVGGWKVDFAAGRSFSDLSEAERAEVLNSRFDWKVEDVIGSRWAKAEPAPPPAPETTETP